MFRGLIVLAIGVLLLSGSISIMIYKEKVALQREWDVLNNPIQVDKAPDGNILLYKKGNGAYENLSSEFPFRANEWVEHDRWRDRHHDIYFYLSDTDHLARDTIYTP